MADESVEEVELRVRDIVTSPRRSSHLRKDSEAWHSLVASLDAIGDTQLAIRYYLGQPERDRSDFGRSYLTVYGILQVLYVQQDAARTLTRRLNLRWKWPRELRAVRDIRNLSTGHPTDSEQGSAAIARNTLSSTGFSMLVFPKGGARSEARRVNIPDLIKRQMIEMSGLLADVVEHLMEDEREHRRAFRDRPLAAILSQVSYAVEKVGQGLRDSANGPLASFGLDKVRGVIEETRCALAERGVVEAYADSVGSTLNELEFVVRRLEQRLAGGHSEWEVGDVEVYRHYLRAQLDELRDRFREIDEEYESDEIR